MSLRRSPRWLLVLTLSLFAPMAAAQEQPLDLAEEADLHFRVAVDYYRAGRFQDALQHLLLSNRLAPNKNVVFNIARTYEQLSEYAQAYRHYSDFLLLESDPSRRAPALEALGRIRGRVALVDIQTGPPGATVYVDRKDLGARGVTPRTLALEPGEHTILIEMEGHEPANSQPVQLQVGSTAQVKLQLEQILGELSVEGSPAGAQIRVDDEKGPVIGTLPAVVSLPPGPHVLIVSHPGYQTRQEMVQIAPRQKTQAAINLDLVTGAVVVNAAERDALIEIDGEAAGFTPAVLPTVPSGTHTIRVTMSGFRPYEQTIEVLPERQVTVNVRLRSLQEVTAASRAAESVEDAPASVSLISQEEIRAFGYQTLYEALGGVRGVYQTNDLTYQYLGFRGFGRLGDYGNRVLVTLDGHTMNDDQLGSSYVGTDLMADLMDVERLEVVRGPGSTLYGTNAFFGVVNVVTRDADTMNRPHVSVGADGDRTARLRLGAGGEATDDVGAWASLSGTWSQGRDYYFAEFDNDELGDGISEDADGSLSGTLQLKGWAQDWSLQGYLNTRAKAIPNGAFETVLGDPDARSSDTRGFLEARYEPSIGDNIQIYSRVWLDRYVFEGTYPYDDPSIGTVVDAWDGAWFGAEPRVVATVLPWLQFTAGAEARVHYLAHISSEDVAGLYLDEDVPYQVMSGYAVADFTAGRWFSANLGGRVDYFQGLSTEEGASDLSVNPRAAFIVKPNQNNIVKLLAGRAFRAPSPYEIWYNDEGYYQIASDRLRPELIYTGELEYTHRFSDVTSLVGTAFYNQIEDLIDTFEVPGAGVEGNDVIQYQNEEDGVQTIGQEFEVRRDWREGWMVSLSQSFQYTRAAGFGEDGWELTNSPMNLVAVKGAAPLVSGSMTLATRLRFETGRLMTDEESYTDPALLWDIIITGRVPTSSLEYGFGVRNALDWKVDHPGNWDHLQLALEQPGRNLWAQLTYNF